MVVNNKEANEKKLIYFADDDDSIRSLVEMFLKNEGFNVVAFVSGDALYDEFLKKTPDLIILDVMMPGTDGLSICSKIRQESTLPIVLLTAKDTDVDQITGITIGCDDYITKPFNPKLFVVKIKALFRRIEIIKDSSYIKNPEIIYGDLKLNRERQIIECDNRELLLTKTEFACLAYLMDNSNKPVSREELLKNVWGYETLVETRVVDETIRKIRKKLAGKTSNIVIENKWGYGYLLKIK